MKIKEHKLTQEDFLARFNISITWVFTKQQAWFPTYDYFEIQVDLVEAKEVRKTIKSCNKPL